MKNENFSLSLLGNTGLANFFNHHNVCERELIYEEIITKSDGSSMTRRKIMRECVCERSKEEEEFEDLAKSFE